MRVHQRWLFQINWVLPVPPTASGMAWVSQAFPFAF